MESGTARLDKCGLNHIQNARFWVSPVPCLIHEAEDIGGWEQNDYKDLSI